MNLMFVFSLEFSGLCYCLFVNVLCSVVFDTTLISYHEIFLFVKHFFELFSFIFYHSTLPRLLTSTRVSDEIYITTTHYFCQQLFFVFLFFLLLFRLPQNPTFTFYYLL